MHLLVSQATDNALDRENAKPLPHRSTLNASSALLDGSRKASHGARVAHHLGLFEQIDRALRFEKIASARTTELIEQARAAGHTFKEIGFGVAEHRAVCDHDLIAEGERLEVAFRQRLAQRRRRARRVIGDHRKPLAEQRRGGARSRAKEATMNPRYRRTEVTEEWHDEAPPVPGSCPPPALEHDHSHVDDHVLGDPGPAPGSRDHEDR
jgi:hypothetical protein